MNPYNPDTTAIIESIPERKVPTAVFGGGIAAMAIGLGAFLFGVFTDPIWTWGAVLVALVFVLALAQGGVMFSVVATLTWARWSQPFKRVAESFGIFLPVAWLGLLVFLLLGNGIYPWHDGQIIHAEPISLVPHSEAVRWASKPFWLQMGFLTARQLLSIGFITAISWAYIRMSLRPDLIKAKAQLGDRAPSWWNWIIGNGTDLALETTKNEKIRSALAPILAASYYLVFTLMACDLIMSLAPHWYTNMFGGWISTSSYWLGLQGVGVVTLIGRDWLGLKGWVKNKSTHDLGKLILAFTMAWAYQGYAQLMPIWYTNMPEETDFIMLRLNLPQWSWLAQTVLVLCFLMPFTILLSRGIKKMRWPFVALLLCMMTGVFLERTMLVMPSIYLEETFPIAKFLIISVGVWVGALGAFITVITQFLARVPTIAVADTKLGDHTWDVHVHSLDAHHAHH